MYQLIANDQLDRSLEDLSCSYMQCLLSIQPRLGSCPLWLRTISPHSPVLSIVLLLKLLVSLLIFFGSVFLQFLLLHSVVELTAIRGGRRTHRLLDTLHSTNHHVFTSPEIPRLGLPQCHKPPDLHNLRAQALHRHRRRNQSLRLRHVRNRHPHPKLRLGPNRLSLRRGP